MVAQGNCYRTQASLDAERASESRSVSRALRAERDRLAARLDKGCRFLDDLAGRVGQGSGEYKHYFAIWLRILHDYEKTRDEITALEARQEFSEWHARRTAKSSGVIVPEKGYGLGHVAAMRSKASIK